MTAVAPTSPLVATLARFVASSQTAVFDYANDFLRLWSAFEGDPHELPGRVLIVWSRTPDDPATVPISTGEQVTPIDWAACAAVVRPELIVTIVDIGPRQHHEAPAWRLYAHLGGRTRPWLKLVGWNELADAESARALATLLHDSSGGADSVRPADFLRFRRATLVDSTPSAGRHSITNLVGPFFLLGGTFAGRSPHAIALARILTAAGLMTPADERRVSTRHAAARLVEMARCDVPVRIVLVDDQWHQGWAEWVAIQLGLPWDSARAASLSPDALERPAEVTGDGAISLWVASNPHWLAKRLRATTAGGTDARFLFTATEGRDHAEIVLLDLRLFAGAEDAERTFVSAIVDVARRFVEPAPSLAWPGFERHELEMIEAWCCGQDATGRALALTLLPRLAALVDMALPIVVFSSTGQRELVEILRPYENVITTFTKPRFFGEGAEDPEDIADALDDALCQATLLLAGRRAVIRNASSRRAGSGPAPTFRHAMLYLDESGDAGRLPFTLGGILALFPSRDEEDRFDQELKHSLGVHWGPSGLPKHAHADRVHVERIGTQVLAESGRAPAIALRAVALSVEARPRNIATRIGDVVQPDRDLDRLHRAMIHATVESALFHLIHDGEMHQDWTFGVCTDVRSKPARIFSADALRELRERFGMYASELRRGERRCRAVVEVVAMLAATPDVQRDLYLALAPFLNGALPVEVDAQGQWHGTSLELHASLDAMSNTAGASEIERVTRAVEDRLARSRSLSFLNGDAVLPIVEDVMGRYEGAQRLDRVRVVEARACHLPEGQESALAPANRSLHFLADWVVGAVREARGPNRTALPAWVDEIVAAGGCDEVFDDDLRQDLHLARLALRGELVRAGAGLLAAGPQTRSSLRARCADTVAAMLAESAGTHFVDACMEVPAARRAMAPLSGQVERIRDLDGRHGVIRLRGGQRLPFSHEHWTDVTIAPAPEMNVSAEIGRRPGEDAQVLSVSPVIASTGGVVHGGARRVVGVATLLQSRPDRWELVCCEGWTGRVTLLRRDNPHTFGQIRPRSRLRFDVAFAAGTWRCHAVDATVL